MDTIAGGAKAQFIIPRPNQKNKREMPENQGKTPSFPPTSCPEPAGQGEWGEVTFPALNINSLRSSKSFLPRKNVGKGPALVMRGGDRSAYELGTGALGRN